VSVTRYQALTQDFSVPPLAPPFAEGWQPSDVRPCAPSRNAGRDTELVVRAAAATTPGTFDADRTPYRPAVAATTRQTHDVLSVPPLAPAFREGWQSDRCFPKAVGKTTPHDEQQSGTVLATAPLAPPFREGWQSDRCFPKPVARTTPHDEQSSGTLLSTPPLAPAFREGWQGSGDSWPARLCRESVQVIPRD